MVFVLVFASGVFNLGYTVLWGVYDVGIVDCVLYWFSWISNLGFCVDYRMGTAN